MSLESLNECMDVPAQEASDDVHADCMFLPEQKIDDNGREYRTADGGWVPNNTYVLDGRELKTDDYGHIYQVDGAYFLNDYFVVDGLLYLTNDTGCLIPDDVLGDQQNSTEVTEVATDGDNPFVGIPDVLCGMGEPEWEKLDDAGNPLFGYTNIEGTIDWYNSNGLFVPSCPEVYSSTLKDTAKGTPIEGNGGSWTDGRGNSTWIPDPNYVPPEKSRNPDKPYSNPDNLSWKELLKKYDLDGINFNDGEPDFSTVAKGEVQIDDFSKDRHGKDGNFEQATKKLAEQRDCTPGEVKAWMKENNYTWHECSDCKTMQKVPNEIHANIHHDGGVSKVKEANNASGGET